MTSSISEVEEKNIELLNAFVGFEQGDKKIVPR